MLYKNSDQASSDSVQALLQSVNQLAQLDPDSDEYHFLHTRLVRNRNAVNWALRQAVEIVGD